MRARVCGCAHARAWAQGRACGCVRPGACVRAHTLEQRTLAGGRAGGRVRARAPACMGGRADMHARQLARCIETRLTPVTGNVTLGQAEVRLSFWMSLSGTRGRGRRPAKRHEGKSEGAGKKEKIERTREQKRERERESKR